MALWNDVRHAARGLRRSPGFALVVVGSLALGIGVNTTIFSWVDAALLKPLPIADPGRVVSIHTVTANSPDYLTISHLNFLDYEKSNQGASAVFSHLAFYRPAKFSLSAGGEPELLAGQLVSAGYFPLLGIEPAHGRFFLPEEDRTPGTHPVVVLGHGLWQRRFGADPAVVGRPLTLNGRVFTVVGVAPPGFRGARVLEPAELWAPSMMYRELLNPRLATWFEQRRPIILFGLGRLAPGVSIERADAAMKTVALRLAAEYPADNQGRSLALLPIQRFTISPNYRGSFVTAGGVLMSVVGLVLLIACANVANLLLARALARRREIGVRLALGAGRAGLVRQLLAESLLLAGLGGVAGLGVAVAIRHLLWASRPAAVPPTLDVGLHPRVLAFTLGVSVATGLLFGLVPALQSTRPDLVAALKSDAAAPSRGGRRSGLRDLLVVAQIAMSLASLVGAGLFLKAFRSAQAIPPGFEAEKLLVLSFDAGAQGYDEARGQQLYRDAVARAVAVPGVASAAVAENAVLLGDVGLRRTVQVEGREPPPGETGWIVQINAVGPEYFATVGVPLRDGRAFREADRKDAPPVAVVNETMAAQLWPGQQAVGRRFSFFGVGAPVEVVGIARNVKYGFLGEEPPMYLYIPMAQSYASAATLHVRTEADPARILGDVRRAVQALDPALPLVNVRTARGVLADALWAPRTAAGLLAAFGLLALALAALGIYGVMSYLVEQGRREIAVRMALGAERRAVLGRVLGRGMAAVGAGIALGSGVAFALARAAASLLYGTPPVDLSAWTGAALLLAAVACAATLLPARRAAATDPILALRER